MHTVHSIVDSIRHSRCVPHITHITRPPHHMAGASHDSLASCNKCLTSLTCLIRQAARLGDERTESVLELFAHMHSNIHRTSTGCIDAVACEAGLA